MKMKDYMAPEMDVLEIKMQAHLMAGSVETSDDDDDDLIDGGGSNDPNVPFG
ncbi:MAG: hypothetical protein IJ588_02290 [Prevotella sp.]|nr:hypothetical protein [Prevotella sp.]